MNTNLNYSSTSQYYIDYINNKDGIHILEIKRLDIPFEYKAFIQEGKTNSNCRTHSDYVTLLILKYCSENSPLDIQDDLIKNLERQIAIYKYIAEGGAYEGAYEHIILKNINIPIDLFEHILNVQPYRKETSLYNMLHYVIPKYVLGILYHYHYKFLKGEAL